MKKSESLDYFKIRKKIKKSKCYYKMLLLARKYFELLININGDKKRAEKVVCIFNFSLGSLIHKHHNYNGFDLSFSYKQIKLMEMVLDTLNSFHYNSNVNHAISNISRFDILNIKVV